jgi:hypothetical protein
METLNNVFIESSMKSEQKLLNEIGAQFLLLLKALDESSKSLMEASP